MARIGNPFETVREQVPLVTSPPDRVEKTTCYMCACRCGIRVHIEGDEVTYIDGNPDHPVNKGVLCAKGSAGLMSHLSPARLRKPLLRTGERGAGEFREIEWEEALSLAEDWLAGPRRTDPAKLAFFTGRDQSQSFTGWWAKQYGTPNFAAHGGFCSVNMAAAGLYSVGGSFWEFGEPDWDRTRLFVMFGVAEDHDSNPIKAGLGRLKSREDTRFVSVNPIRTGYSAIADQWLGIRPGTDGLLILALIHELLRTDRIDDAFLVKYTNAPWLVVEAPGQPEDGTVIRDREGRPLCYDHYAKRVVPADGYDIAPALVGRFDLEDGRTGCPAFSRMAERYLSEDYSPAAAAAVTGIDEAAIRALAAEMAHVAFDQAITIEQSWVDAAGRHHPTMVGRPVSFHAMRGISAHANGFHTCRALHLLQMLLGAVDVPGGWRYKSPFPKPIPPAPKPAGPVAAPGQPLAGMPLGHPDGPEDLLVDEAGEPLRIDKAYSWEFPLAAHGLMHMVLRNAWAGDPYRIDVLMMYMSNMAWNSAMNTTDVVKYLTDKDPETGEYIIPKIIYSDAFHSETVAYADLVLPDTTYLERYDCISLLDRPISNADGPADAIRHPVVSPGRDVRPFQDVLLELGGRLGLPGFVGDDGAPAYPGGYADYIANHERTKGVGPLAGWRGDGGSHGKGPANPDQIAAYRDHGSFWHHELAPDQQYYRFANRSYLNWAHGFGFIPSPDPIILQLYSEPVQKFRAAARAAEGRRPPERQRGRVARFFDPLPVWYPPFEGEALDERDFPLHALSQRPMHMYHSWGSHNAWLRQITARNRLFIHRETARRLGIGDDDWVWIVGHHGRVRGQIKTMDGVNRHTVWTWNAIGKRSGTWGLAADAPEARQGFLLNHLITETVPGGEDAPTNSDPVTGQAAWFDLRVRIEPCRDGGCETWPLAETIAAPAGLPPSPDRVRAGRRRRPAEGEAVSAKDWLSAALPRTTTPEDEVSR